MQAISILMYLFFLTVGRSPKDIQEFARIQGDWDIVSIETNGKKTPSKPGQGITFRITSLPAATTQQPLNSLAYWGRLNTHRTPFVIEGRILSAYFEQEMPESSSDTDAPPFPNIPITSLVTTRTIYELKGDTMRLFIAEVANESDKLPTKMMTTPGSHSALFELKRKSKLASTAGKTP